MHQGTGLKEVLERPNYVFNVDSTYTKGGAAEGGKPTGKWYHDPKGKMLLLHLNEPLYSPSRDQVDPSFLEEYDRLIAIGAIMPITTEVLWIGSVDAEELIMLEDRPIEGTIVRMKYLRE